MTLNRLFWILAALFVPTLIAMARIDVGLHSVHAPLGIVSFEFCGYAGSCLAILDEWGARGREAAMLSLGLDYLFLLSYAGMLWAGLLLGSERLGVKVRRFVRLSAAGALVAGMADAAENYSLIRIVGGGDVSLHGVLAGTFAAVKFVLVVVALLAWAGLGVRRLIVGRAA